MVVVFPMIFWYLKIEKKHKEHLKIVLETLKEKQLNAKQEKCDSSTGESIFSRPCDLSRRYLSGSKEDSNY